MRKVPYFAGAALVGVTVVVALNWGARIPVESPYAVPTVSVKPETIQLFSAFGGHVEPPKFPQPAEPASVAPEIKLPPKKLPQVQSTKDPRQIDDEGKSEKTARSCKFRARSVAGQFRTHRHARACEN